MAVVFKQYPHRCHTINETFPPKPSKESICYKLKKFWYSLILVSTHNSLTLEYFSSEREIRNEKMRHYQSPFFFIIHPLSKLAAFCDFYYGLFYVFAIFIKLFDFAFIRTIKLGSREYAPYVRLINIVDILSWINLLLSFFCGVIISKKNKLILINFAAILRYRLKSFLFWAELISSVPKCMICTTPKSCSNNIWIFMASLRIFIVFICIKPSQLLRQSFSYLKIESRAFLIIFQLSYMMAFTTHAMACTAYAISRYRNFLTGEFGNNTWLLYDGLIHKDISKQCAYAYFKASAQTFGITISEFQEDVNWEESVVGSINYITGKIIYLIMWVAVLHVLLAKDLQEIRFQEIISQLKRWMDNKELPKHLQKRVEDYYNFYYRKRFFSKREVHKVIPESLNAKVKSNMYKTLKKSNMTLFSLLSEDEIQSIGEYFFTEVYSPNDVIIYSGTKGDSLYLLASGSVAVYSRSGKEICHLHDGAYFGELSLLLSDQRITATIVAIETTKVYKIAKKYFEKYILSKKELHDMFMKQAEIRLQAITRAEEEYQRTLFQQMYKTSNLQL